jgi:hypothetical protein
MTTKQARKSSGIEEPPVTDHRKIKCQIDRDLGPVENRPCLRASSLCRASYVINALLDVGVR